LVPILGFTSATTKKKIARLSTRILSVGLNKERSGLNFLSKALSAKHF